MFSHKLLLFSGILFGLVVGGAGAGVFTNTDCLAGIGKLLALALGGWYFGWYFWYSTFRQEPSFNDLAGTPF
jgi:hypothetical protein